MLKADIKKVRFFLSIFPCKKIQFPAGFGSVLILC